MGTDMMDRFLGWVFILGMVVFLAALVFMLAMGYDPWTIAWISVLTGSVIGMTAGMVVMIKSFAVDGQNGSSS
ncbi:MAG: hypothetical protein KAQ96_06780 [Thermoplasmata archaeon]|nr:hypothetical protein [Thermoplasmata archaeon]